MNQTVICSAGEADSTHYVDPNTLQVFSIDHITLVRSLILFSVPLNLMLIGASFSQFNKC
jgi:hypothetical protein